jgi:hypothetical protein
MDKGKRLKLSEVVVGKRVPDETLERNTKMPLKDESSEQRARQARSDASVLDSIKKELERR